MDTRLTLLAALCCVLTQHGVSLYTLGRVSQKVNVLGEGGVWNPNLQSQFWVDIPSGVVSRLDPSQSTVTAMKAETIVSFAVPRCNGQGLVIAQRNRVDFLGNDGVQVPFVSKEKLGIPDDQKTNDGKADPAGRLWFGTLSTLPVPLSQQPSSAGLYSVTSDGVVKQHLSNLTLSNGMDWTQDKKTFLLADTGNAVIYAFDYDIENGEISNQRPFINLPGLLPDGLTLDADGNVWVAFFGGSAVAQFDSKTGKELQRIDMSPVTQITCPNFGGRNLDELYITTASRDLTPQQLQEQPDAGALFKVTGLNVRGRIRNFFSG